MKNFRFSFYFGLFLVVLAFGCTTKNAKEQGQKVTISVSILPQKYLVDRLTDSSIRVNVMVPPGTSPEMYEPSPMQMKEVGNSVVYFAVGPLEFESTILPRIKELNPNIKFVNLSDGINLLEGHRHREIMGEEDHHHVNYDPHIWTSTTEFKKMAENTFNVLCDVFPDKKELFQGNLLKLNQDIDNLDLRIKKMVEGAKTKDFLIYHPALTYFSKEYGLNQVAIEEDGKNPSAQKLTELLSLAKKEGINSVFIQSQFDSHNAEIVAMELGGEIVKIDPLGYDWLKNMNDMVDKLAVALKSK
jgi:zinc transport system substrate-binding protein